MNKFLKVLLIMLCAVVLVVLSVAGTLAYLSMKTATVTNTFTAGDISITLKQTNNSNSYTIVPGQGYKVDPVVTVAKDSEDCWLFVKIDTDANFGSFFTYTIADGWTALDATNHPGVYYRKATSITANTSFDIIKSNSIAVIADVTKANLNDLGNASLGMNFTAYAVQLHGFDTVAAAWAIAEALDTTTPEGSGAGN